LPSCENLPQKKKTLVWKYKWFVLGKNALNLSHHQLVYKGNPDFFYFPLLPFAKFGKSSREKSPFHLLPNFEEKNETWIWFPFHT
jgi:hypothetical protein